jgi:hypothetical protein
MIEYLFNSRVMIQNQVDQISRNLQRKILTRKFLIFHKMRKFKLMKKISVEEKTRNNDLFC